MQTHQPLDNQSLKFPPLSVAVNDAGSHIGVLYHLDSRGPRFLHLAWHRDLRDEAGLPDKHAWCACSGFEELEGRDFASWLAKIYAANRRRIPYGFNFWPGGCFNDDGLYEPGSHAFGLTCATFVMSLFESHSYPIVDADSWVRREEDDARLTELVEFLKGARDKVDAPAPTKDHIDAQVAAIGTAARFRPLEVAAAAGIWVDEPISMTEAESVAKQFAQDLKDRPDRPEATPLELVPSMLRPPSESGGPEVGEVAPTPKERKEATAQSAKPKPPRLD